MKIQISIRNIDKNLWIDFVSTLRKENKNISEVIENMLKKYLKNKEKKR